MGLQGTPAPESSTVERSRAKLALEMERQAAHPKAQERDALAGKVSHRTFQTTGGANPSVETERDLAAIKAQVIQMPDATSAAAAALAKQVPPAA